MIRNLSSLVLGVILALTVTVHGSVPNSGNADSTEQNVIDKLYEYGASKLTFEERMPIYSKLHFGNGFLE